MSELDITQAQINTLDSYIDRVTDTLNHTLKHATHTMEMCNIGLNSTTVIESISKWTHRKSEYSIKADDCIEELERLSTIRNLIYEHQINSSFQGLTDAMLKDKYVDLVNENIDNIQEMERYKALYEECRDNSASLSTFIENMKEDLDTFEENYSGY